jgi:hypothetical protein
MATRQSETNVSSICSHPNSRQLFDNPPGLNGTQTRVLQAACDEAIRLGTLRLTVRDIVGRLSWMKDPAQTVAGSLDQLVKRRYLVVDDQPELAEAVIHVTLAGFQEYAIRFVDGYAELSSRALSWLAANGAGYNALDVAHACGISEFLVTHILEMAEASASIRLSRYPHYLVVSEVLPQLRWQMSGKGFL